MPVGRAVAVIGAGNTAVDAVTQARRLGAGRVMMVYRRTQAEMPAFDYEYELAKRDEVEFLWQTAPVEILAGAGSLRVSGLRCVRTEAGEPDSSGRRSARVIEGSEFVVPVDMVIKATGQQKMKELLSSIPGVELDASGRVRVETETMQTGNPKFFAGGDCVNGGREAVDASQMGKLAAQGIHLALTGDRAAREVPRDLPAERVASAGARAPRAEETQDVTAHGRGRAPRRSSLHKE